jgi:hypothetical protein
MESFVVEELTLRFALFSFDVNGVILLAAGADCGAFCVFDDISTRSEL